jgi:hypothetical protein
MRQSITSDPQSSADQRRVSHGAGWLGWYWGGLGERECGWQQVVGWMGWGRSALGCRLEYRYFSALMKTWWRAVRPARTNRDRTCWNHNFQGVHIDELGVEVSLLSTTRMDSIIAIDCTSLGALTGDSIALDATFGRFQSMRLVARLGPVCAQ